MTYDETLMLMSVMKAAYPEYYRNMKPRDAEGVVTLWADRLGPYPYTLCDFAIKRLIDESKFAPKISEVIDRIKTAAGNSGADKWPITDWHIQSLNALSREFGHDAELSQGLLLLAERYERAMPQHHGRKPLLTAAEGDL